MWLSTLRLDFSVSYSYITEPKRLEL